MNPTFARPDNRLLLGLLCLGQILLIGLPLLWSVKHAILATFVVLALVGLSFSVRRTVVALLFLNIVIPGDILLRILLPGGLRFEEGLFLAALLFALIDLVYRRGFSWPATPTDGPVLIFLLATAFSAAVGLLHDNSTSLILRNVRFPFYYGIFFLITASIDRRAALRYFVPLFILTGFIVSCEYILEFIGAIDLSAGKRFVRVARLHGIILPIALLFIVNHLIYFSDRLYRLVLGLAALPIGLAFVLTVGRGMWGAFAAGLAVTIWLRYRSHPGSPSLWRPLLMVGAVLATLTVTVLLFQRVTGSAISAHALERSRSYVDLERDYHVLGRLASYAIALEAIADYPIIGNGQGTTLLVPLFNEEQTGFELWETWDLDSLYLSILLKMGLIGLAAFAWMYLRTLRLAHRQFTDQDHLPTRAFAASTVAILIAMGILGLADGAMVNGRFTLVFGALFGLVAVLAANPTAES